MDIYIYHVVSPSHYQVPITEKQNIKLLLTVRAALIIKISIVFYKTLFCEFK